MKTIKTPITLEYTTAKGNYSIKLKYGTYQYHKEAILITATGDNEGKDFFKVLVTESNSYSLWDTVKLLGILIGLSTVDLTKVLYNVHESLVAISVNTYTGKSHLRYIKQLLEV